MVDVLTVEQRRLNMSRIKGRNTKPEQVLRHGLHALGLRYRLYVQELPGRPDIVFPRHRAVILVHGCFWHGHDCGLFRLPATRPEFWAAKINGNRARDRRTMEALQALDWRVMTVWECSLKGPFSRSVEDVLAHCAAFVRGNARQDVIEGAWPKRERLSLGDPLP